MALGHNSYSAGHFLFQIDDAGGEGAAFVKSASGGMVKASVLEDQAGPLSTQFKHVGAIEVEPIEIEIGIAQSRPLLEWIRGSWRRDFSRRSGSIVHADWEYKCRFEQWFSGALITATKFPTLDAAGKEAAYVNVTLQPEEVETKKGDNHIVKGNRGENQKLWHPSNFRLDIQGIDCTFVNKIDSFTVTQKVKPLYLGTSRFAELEPTTIEFSHINVYMAADHAGDFISWYENFIVRGDKDTRQERDGHIEFLAPDHKSVLFVIDLNRLGIHRLSLEKSQANAEEIKRIKCELYVESMELKFQANYMK
jgi:hypothetical protein